MLVLSRNESDQIFVGDDIIITVVRIDRGKVRIGVTAPRGVTVFREEVFVSMHGREEADKFISKAKGLS